VQVGFSHVFARGKGFGLLVQPLTTYLAVPPEGGVQSDPENESCSSSSEFEDMTDQEMEPGVDDFQCTLVMFARQFRCS